MMNQRIRLGICHWSVPIPGPYACKWVSEWGLEGMQLEMGEPEKGFPLSKEYVRRAYAEMGEEYHIEFPSVVVGTTKKYALTLRGSSEDQQMTVTAIRKTMDAAPDLRASVVMIPSFGASAMESTEDMRRTAEVLSWACDLAMDKGLTVATENLLGVKEMYDLFEMVNRPNLRVYFDTQNHFLRKGYDIAEMIRALSPLLCSEIHAKDGKGHLSGSLLGEGDAGFFRAAEALKQIGYSGWIHLENYYDREPLSLQNENAVTLIQKDIGVLKDVFKLF
jgi:sugar phosphate isomerase/epimerase